VGGLGIGFAVGDGVARGVRWLRARREDAVVLDEFLLLGVIAVSYGAAVACGALGFLAVFAAGIALRRADDIHAGSRQVADKPPLTPSMLNVNEQLERIVEVAIVLLVGAMISTGYWSTEGLLLAALLILVIRPVAVWLGLIGDPAARAPRRLLAWFGIRGIGSVYYAVYVASHDIRYSTAVDLISCVFTVIAASIIVHGISAAPLMDLYQRRRGQSRGARTAVSDKR
jgi:NhaP-type Na+/H+ or K+/H+ antiporter